jgi:hypothetical protein
MITVWQSPYCVEMIGQNNNGIDFEWMSLLDNPKSFSQGVYAFYQQCSVTLCQVNRKKINTTINTVAKIISHCLLCVCLNLMGFAIALPILHGLHLHTGRGKSESFSKC